MKTPDDVRDLCTTMCELGVEPEIIATAKSDLSAHYDQAANWMCLASAVRKRKHYQASLATYEAALSRFPRSHQMWGNVAILYREWERYQEALEAIERALELDPKYVHALESKAMTLERMHRFREAAETYSAVLNQDPQRPLCWNNLGNCLLFIGQKEDAPQCFENAIGIDPSYLDPLFNLAATYYESKKFDKALAAINSLLRIKPDDSTAQRLRGEILKRPEVPEPILPTPIHKEPIVFRLSTNLDGDGTLVAPDLSTSQMVIRGSDVAEMTRLQAARKVGFRSWDTMHLGQLVQDALAKSSQPQGRAAKRLFVSYRWESDAHNAWVERFAQDLVSRGYQVVFDKFVSREHKPPSVPELVSRLVQCKTFVAILTEGYRRRVEVLPGEATTIFEDGWVYDEWRCALLLSSMDRLSIMGVWRSGPAVPLPFRKNTVVDFRLDCDYGMAMDRVFPAS